MGFRQGAFATVWSVETVSDTMTKARISTSKKDKQTDAYETDFSDYVCFVGTAVAKKASMLKAKDRIKLGDCEVTNKFDKDKKVKYTNFRVFSFDKTDGSSTGGKKAQPAKKQREVDEGYDDDSSLPF